MPVKKSVSFAFLFIVVMPLILVSWLGWRSVRAEQDRFQTKIQELQRNRLQEFVDNQVRWLNSIEDAMALLLDTVSSQSIDTWPEYQKRNRFVHQIFSVDASGELLWPNESVQVLSQAEQEFQLLYNKGLIDFSIQVEENGASEGPNHWSTWFDGPGQQWAFWIEGENRIKLGVVMDRAGFMAEAIAQLPDQTRASSYISREDSFSLINEYGESLYRWGYELDGEGDSSFLEIPLPKPLNAWHIRLIPKSTVIPEWYKQPLVLVMVLSITGFSILILAAANYFFRETRREYDRARQRVSFVNQVSHELKTPLTNIQLYTELLEEAVDKNDWNKYVGIIREESAKLGRMIQNVLSFARNQRASLQLHPREIIPDDLILHIVGIHKLGMERQGISIEMNLDSTRAIKMDPQAFEQILGNILSNAEKYAANSKVAISSRQTDEELLVSVHDSGPGIPHMKRNSIFEPFVRLESRANEGVSGTGIGLSIARDIARTHGGDVLLEPADKGARFVLRIKGMV